MSEEEDKRLTRKRKDWKRKKRGGEAEKGSLRGKERTEEQDKELKDGEKKLEKEKGDWEGEKVSLEEKK